MYSSGRPQKICSVCCVDAHSEPEKIVLDAAREQRGIIVASVNYGITIQTRAYITVMTVVYVGKAEELEKTFFIAK